MAAFACRNFLLFSGLKNKKKSSEQTVWQLYAYVANESTLRCEDDKKIAFLEGWKWTQTTNLIGFHQASIVMERPYQVININVFLLSKTVGKKFNIFNHLPSVYLALINLD